MHYPGGSQSAPIQFYSSQFAAEPSDINYYRGLTAKQVNDRNLFRAQKHGGFNQAQLVPQDPSSDTEYICRELDGSFTRRTANTIMSSLKPGQWAYSSDGYLYWIRHSQE